jgi:hypothetical protein
VSRSSVVPSRPAPAPRRGCDHRRVGEDLAAAARDPPAVNIRADQAAVSVPRGIGADPMPAGGNRGQCLLHQILGMLPVAAQPVCGVQQVITLRGHEFLEFGAAASRMINPCHSITSPSALHHLLRRHPAAQRLLASTPETKDRSCDDRLRRPHGRPAAAPRPTLPPTQFHQPAPGPEPEFPGPPPKTIPDVLSGCRLHCAGRGVWPLQG